MTFVFEFAGWIGAVLVLVGYILVTKRGTSWLYHAINFAGAVGLFANAFHHGAFPSVGLDIVWVGVAIVGMRQAKDMKRSSTIE